MCVMPSATAARSTATAAARSAGGPNTCGPGTAKCIAPYPMRVTVRSAARVNVPPGRVVAAVGMPHLSCGADALAFRHRVSAAPLPCALLLAGLGTPVRRRETARPSHLQWSTLLARKRLARLGRPGRAQCHGALMCRPGQPKLPAPGADLRGGLDNSPWLQPWGSWLRFFLVTPPRV